MAAVVSATGLSWTMTDMGPPKTGELILANPGHSGPSLSAYVAQRSVVIPCRLNIYARARNVSFLLASVVSLRRFTCVVRFYSYSHSYSCISISFGPVGCTDQSACGRTRFGQQLLSLTTSPIVWYLSPSRLLDSKVWKAKNVVTFQ